MTGERTRRLWVLFAIAMFFHGVADPLITVIGMNYSGSIQEGNQLVRVSMDNGMVFFTGTQFLFIVVVTGLFALLTLLMRRGSAQSSRRIYRLTVVGLIGTILWGVTLVIRNSYVIWSGL